VLVGHVLARLADLPNESVHCVVTSPPYYSLRSYGTAPQVWGGDPNCPHEWGPAISQRALLYAGKHTEPLNNGWSGNNAAREKIDVQQGAFCHCGAWRGDLGLEPTPELFIQHLVEVFREVRRVLRKDGTLWLNIGDSYAAGHGGSTTAGNYIPKSGSEKAPNPRKRTDVDCASWSTRDVTPRRVIPGLKPKDLMMLPAQLALALRADGWWLRSEIVWAKRAPMPESCTDRPTCAHEKVFLLTKSARYFYDAEAVKEEAETAGEVGLGFYPNRALAMGRNPSGNELSGGADKIRASHRNLRNVWHLGPEPFPEAHFATFPSEIPRRAILAGTSAKGVCGATIKKLRVRSDLTPEQQERVTAFLRKSGRL
jgi:DNA modification methylase